MIPVPAPDVFPQFFNQTGTAPLVGGLLFTYIAGTSTKQATYTDATAKVLNANPIVLDSAGMTAIWIDPSLSYKFVLAPANDTDPPQSPLRTQDNVVVSFNIGNVPFYPATAAETAAGVVPTNYTYPAYDVRRYGAIGNNAALDTQGWAQALLLGGDIYGPPLTFITNTTQTIAVAGTHIRAYGATLQASATSNFQDVLYASNLSGIVIEGLTADANHAARGLTTRVCGIELSNCTDSLLFKCTALNALGYAGISGYGVAFSGTTGQRNRAESCLFLNCGTAALPADGIYTCGNQNLIVGCIANTCADTGFVIESSNQSGIIGCTANYCGAVAGITASNAALAFSDNFIDGLTGTQWIGGVTGGIQIGIPNSVAATLQNTRISGVNLSSGVSTGPAINVRQTGGTITQLTLAGITINGAASQGILLNGSDVLLSGFNIQNCGAAAIQVQSGANVLICDGQILTNAATFGIYTSGVNNVVVSNTFINCNGMGTYGVYFDGTATGCASLGNTVLSPTSTRIFANAASAILGIGFVPSAAFCLPASAMPTASVVGAVGHKLAIYDLNGNAIGFVPIYNSIT